MKTRVLFVVLGLLVAGCANQDGPYAISRFSPQSGCQVTVSMGAAAFMASGSLDVAAGNPEFWGQITAVPVGAAGTSSGTQELVVGGTTLENAERNQPLFTEIDFSYRTSKRLAKTPAVRVVPFFIDTLELNGQLDAVVQLLSTEVGQLLFDQLTPATPGDTDLDQLELDVDVEMRGEYSASKNAFSTGVSTLPIRVFRSTPALSCPDPMVPNDPNTQYARHLRKGIADDCQYTGQAYDWDETPSPPTQCCDPTAPTPGC